jgi:hypothetical protein
MGIAGQLLAMVPERANQAIDLDRIRNSCERLPEQEIGDQPI